MHTNKFHFAQVNFITSTEAKNAHNNPNVICAVYVKNSIWDQFNLMKYGIDKSKPYKMTLNIIELWKNDSLIWSQIKISW